MMTVVAKTIRFFHTRPRHFSNWRAGRQEERPDQFLGTGMAGGRPLRRSSRWERPVPRRTNWQKLVAELKPQREATSWSARRVFCRSEAMCFKRTRLISSAGVQPRCRRNRFSRIQQSEYLYIDLKLRLNSFWIPAKPRGFASGSLIVISENLVVVVQNRWFFQQLDMSIVHQDLLPRHFRGSMHRRGVQIRESGTFPVYRGTPGITCA